jgi:hypothetical protein
MLSTTLARETTESEAIHHLSFVSREKERQKTLVRLSQRGTVGVPLISEEPEKHDHREEIRASMFDEGLFERSHNSRRFNETMARR